MSIEVCARCTQQNDLDFLDTGSYVGGDYVCVNCLTSDELDSLDSLVESTVEK